MAKIETVTLKWTGAPNVVPAAKSQAKVYRAILRAQDLTSTRVWPGETKTETRAVSFHRVTPDQVKALLTANVTEATRTVTLPLGVRGRKPAQGQTLAAFLAGERPRKPATPRKPKAEVPAPEA